MDLLLHLQLLEVLAELRPHDLVEPFFGGAAQRSELSSVAGCQKGSGAFETRHYSVRCLGRLQLFQKKLTFDIGTASRLGNAIFHDGVHLRNKSEVAFATDKLFFALNDAWQSGSDNRSREANETMQLLGLGN